MQSLPVPIPNSYWVHQGSFLAGEYPGDELQSDAEARLAGFLDAGIDYFIDLTEVRDPLEPYEETLLQLAKRSGRTVTYVRRAVRDLHHPSVPEMRDILDEIDRAIADGRRVYVHCWGGVGRTGTVVGCHLTRRGLEGDAALRRVAELFGTMTEEKLARHPTSPETTAQRRFVREWKAGDHRRSLTHIRGCLLGGAVGDALGAPVEFLSLASIRRKYGAAGIVDFDEAYGRVGAITDDTQMTMWTAEGVLRGITRGNAKGIGGPTSTLGFAYRRWLYTQDGRLPDHIDAFERKLILGGKDVDRGWLRSVKALRHQRAPGNTCLSALRARELGSRENPLNGSKGCGGVMRVAPVALFRDDPDSIFDLACHAAALTHGHPTGWLAAGAFALILYHVGDGSTLEAAVRLGVDRVSRERDHAETTNALERALRLWAAGGPPTAELVESLGAGWVAEEALAIAVYCALAANDDFSGGVCLAVNHSGDSDSTGSMAGQILGLKLGESAIPEAWTSRVELARELRALAADIVTVHRDGHEWWKRYPGY
ncbi:MAG TPA: ADP-ribosylglycohydrolase family protein [Gemmatimonadaceae bacterium]|nr:ADP-ribosylglycohydrolase family protein [Gemmatimonadaceae bacterium]